MKTIKELNENCSLIAEFRMPAFVCRKSKLTCQFSRANKAAIYCNNMGKFYLVRYINKLKISEHDSYEDAIDKFTKFITNVLE